MSRTLFIKAFLLLIVSDCCIKAHFSSLPPNEDSDDVSVGYVDSFGWTGGNSYLFVPVDSEDEQEEVFF